MGNKLNIMEFETVTLDDEKSALVIIDQTLLPNKIDILYLSDQKDIWDAIYKLKVRGAPAIGVAAAIGIYLAVKEIETTEFNEFFSLFTVAKEYLASSRPTAVNLFWALDRMEQVITGNSDKTVSEIKQLLYKEALAIKQEDIEVCKAIGENGLSLLLENGLKKDDSFGILTHCNAGQLAAVKYGTALSPIHLGHEKGYTFNVYVDETRPLLQGVRLSAFELASNGIDTTVICDNMASQVMKNNWINAVVVGCDCVTANGDVCNKIGTSGVAILAKYYNIPFYVCAPASTINMDIACGKDVTIEQRPDSEITEMWYKESMAPEGVHVFNPAFDFVDNENITAIVTEYGVLKPPFDKSLKEILLHKSTTAEF